MKIQLPNPFDFLHKEDQFFEQLELSLYHTKKAWDKVKKNYTEEDVKNEQYPWLSFVHEPHIEKLFDGKEDEGYKDRQEIAIEINEP